MKKRVFNVEFLIVMIYVPLILIVLWKGIKDTKEIKTESQIKTESNKSKQGCVGFGNEGCIDKVRDNFNLTGKKILGEEYLGNGQFGISFLDPNRGKTYNSKVSTDCNCKILDVNVSIMR